MKLGISYWSKDDHEEFAVHEFADNGELAGMAQFERTGDKYSFSGDEGLLARGLKAMASTESAVGAALSKQNEARNKNRGTDRARPSKA